MDKGVIILIVVIVIFFVIFAIVTAIVISRHVYQEYKDDVSIENFRMDGNIQKIQYKLDELERYENNVTEIINKPENQWSQDDREFIQHPKRMKQQEIDETRKKYIEELNKLKEERKLKK